MDDYYHRVKLREWEEWSYFKSKMKAISKTEFKQAVESGLTTPQLMEKFDLKIGNVKAIAKSLGVTIKRNVVSKYTLVD